MSEICPQCNYVRTDKACCKCGIYAEPESLYGSQTASVCQWKEETREGVRVITTSCGHAMSAEIENFGFRFCGNCGKPIVAG